MTHSAIAAIDEIGQASATRVTDLAGAAGPAAPIAPSDDSRADGFGKWLSAIDARHLLPSAGTLGRAAVAGAAGGPVAAAGSLALSTLNKLLGGAEDAGSTAQPGSHAAGALGSALGAYGKTGLGGILSDGALV